MKYRRGWIAVFLFTLAMINYMDRIALSIAAKPIAHEFQLTPVEMGYLFSSFVWSYTLFLIPIGFWTDRFGTKKLGAIGIFVWSAATAVTGAMGSFFTLLLSRLVMGGGEASSNPVGAKVVREWIPAGERGVVNAIFNSGSYAGPAIAAAMLGFLVSWLGWRWSFTISGGLGFVWLAAWLVFFDTPEKVRWLSDEEKNKILRERDTKVQSGDKKTKGLASLLKTRTMWGLALTQGCNVYTQYLLLAWLPSYLQHTRHLSMAKTGLAAAVPYAVSAALCILAGRISDPYVKSAGVESGRRRNVVTLGLLIGALILLVPFVNSMTVILLIFALVLTGAATTTSQNFALLNDLLPNGGDVAKAMAVLVVGGNVFGLFAPIVTGYVVAATGSYNWAFGIAGGLLLLGVVLVQTLTHRPMATHDSAIAAQPSA